MLDLADSTITRPLYTDGAPVRPSSSIGHVAVASFVGTAIEWYDFFLYGTAAALVFNRLFFPTYDPLVGTVLSFATFAVGFVARPVGGIVFGHFGDRIGRKAMLSLTLLIMGVATFAIGVLPTYGQIGVAAPILLVALRLVQGFGVGGEWGGAVLMAIEHAPANRRGFYGSWPQTGVPAGLLLSTGVFALVSRLPSEAFQTWGWRVPFLLSVALVGVGTLIRVRLAESPSFERVKTAKKPARLPILDVLRHHPRSVLLSMGARLAENAFFYIYTTFVLAYATEQLHVARQTVLTGVLLAAGLDVFAIPLFGWLSDRLGRRPVYMFGAAFSGLFVVPFFLLVGTGRGELVALALVAGITIGHAAMYGPQASFFSELFGTRVRYSGASLGYQLASVLAGGLSPLIAAALLHWTGGAWWAIAAYMVALAGVTLLSVYLAAETSRDGLEPDVASQHHD
jgi:MHS family shikimate/dehydroshikimate transporter-like MFS transporter